MTIKVAAETETYVRVKCPACGCYFFVGADPYEWYRRIGKSLYCPVGHSFVRLEPDKDYSLDREHAPFLKLIVEQVPFTPAPTYAPPPPRRQHDRRKECDVCGKKFKDVAGHKRRMHDGAVDKEEQQP